jgi:hypothetical protein
MARRWDAKMGSYFCAVPKGEAEHLQEGWCDMAKGKTWARSPGKKSSKPKVPPGLKDEVQERANQFIESELKQNLIQPPPEDSDFNYIVDIFSKWYRSYFYFCSKYRCPAPNRISEFFEENFARLEYVGPDSFNLAYMRHTGQWFELYTNLSLEECLQNIREDPNLTP